MISPRLAYENDADAENCELQGTQFSTQLVLGFLGVGDRLFNNLRTGEVHRSIPVPAAVGPVLSAKCPNAVCPTRESRNAGFERATVSW